MKITVDNIMEFVPCEDWTRERVEQYFTDREWVLPILLDNQLSINDRIWLGTSLLDNCRKRLWACDCAERALLLEREAGREPDPRSWDAVVVARRFARGEATVKELDAAMNAAGAATRAARDVAWATGTTTRNAAWAAAEAARSATWDATGTATRAARNAAGTAAKASLAAVRTVGTTEAAERRWQLERLAEYLGENDAKSIRQG